MKNIIYILSILFITSCASSPQECETKANGFIDGIEGQVTMGEDSVSYTHLTLPTTPYV